MSKKLTENLNGPGDKRKSGGVARGGRVSQKRNQSSRGGQGGGYGAGAGAVGPEPQAQSGSPNPDEDELEKDYLEMDDEPLDPQSPLGKLVAQEFDQPIGPPEDEEEDEEDSGKSVEEPIEEDYQGGEQTVTDKDGNELEVDKDAYETAQKTEPTEVQQMDEPFTVQTKEGPAEGKKGDYLAKGVDGEQWPIDQAIFDKTHEFVDPKIQTEAADPTDKRGGYYIDTYKGWHIFALPGYSTPYYYAQGHSSDNYRTTRMVRNFIDKKLAKMGKEKLGEVKGLAAPDFETEVEMDEDKAGLSNVTPSGQNKWRAVRRKDGKPVTVTVPKEATQIKSRQMTPARAKVLNRYNSEPKFKMQLDRAWNIWHDSNIPQSKKRKITKFLKSLGLVEAGVEMRKDRPWLPKLKGDPQPSQWQDKNWNRKKPTVTQVHDRSKHDPDFAHSIQIAHRDIKSKNKNKVRAAYKLLKWNGLLGLKHEKMTWQDIMKGEGKTGGGPRSMKRTSGSKEWGRTKKTGKTSKANLRRADTKRARRQGKDQARMTEGSILQVRPDCWAAKNLIGEVRHFTARKIAGMYANSKGKGNFGIWSNTANIQNEVAGGRWKTNARHFQPEDDDKAKTIARGMVSVDESPDHLSSGGGTSSGSDRHGTFLGKGSLSPEEMKVIDTNWKQIMKVAGALFKRKPYPNALRAIEKYLEKLGVDEKHSMKISGVIAKRFNQDKDPTTMIIPKVIPKIQQEPYTKGSGYSAGGAGGMGPTR